MRSQLLLCLAADAYDEEKDEGSLDMLKDARTRRWVSLGMMAVGGVLIFLAPDDFWLGAILVGMGLLFELIGGLLHRRS